MTDIILRREAFSVSLALHVVSGLVSSTPWFWRWLGNRETSFLRHQLVDVDIVRPVYVAGLARAGSTILLEVLAQHGDVATHQYRDFPFVFIPYWWRQTHERHAPAQFEPQQRAHGDRIMVTPRSPEAMEEMLWMAFFGGLHDPSRSNVLDATTKSPAFEAFYRDHLRKLLFVTGRSRYVAKGNYNLTRLEYILELFPDARFVVPIRQPLTHVASLQKQHALFEDNAARHPRSVAHLDRVGHFEFGAHRRLINIGTGARGVEDGFAADETLGWARYWAYLYGWLHERLQRSRALRDAVLIVRYEDLCSSTARELHRLGGHCGLPLSDEFVEHFAERITPPRYYAPDFTEEQRRAIEEETVDVAAAFGYG